MCIQPWSKVSAWTAPWYCRLLTDGCSHRAGPEPRTRHLHPQNRATWVGANKSAVQASRTLMPWEGRPLPVVKPSGSPMRQDRRPVGGAICWGILVAHDSGALMMRWAPEIAAGLANDLHPPQPAGPKHPLRGRNRRVRPDFRARPLIPEAHPRLEPPPTRSFGPSIPP
jgi:hypothetical protein